MPTCTRLELPPDRGVDVAAGRASSSRAGARLLVLQRAASPTSHRPHEDRDEVEHDRRDDLVRPAEGLEHARDAPKRNPPTAPATIAEGPARRAADPERGHERREHARRELALTADVEQAGPEGERDREARQDQRRRLHDRGDEVDLGQRPSTPNGLPGMYWNGQSRPAPTHRLLYIVSGFAARQQHDQPGDQEGDRDGGEREADARRGRASRGRGLHVTDVAQRGRLTARHGQAELLLVGLLRGALQHDPPLVHDEDAVGEARGSRPARRRRAGWPGRRRAARPGGGARTRSRRRRGRASAGRPGAAAGRTGSRAPARASAGCRRRASGPASWGRRRARRTARCSRARAPAWPAARASRGARSAGARSRAGTRSRPARSRAPGRAGGGPPGCAPTPLSAASRGEAPRDVAAVTRMLPPLARGASRRWPRRAPSGRCRRRRRCPRSRPRARPARARARPPGRGRRSTCRSCDLQRRVARALAGSLSTRSSTSRPTISSARPCFVAPRSGTVPTFLPRRRTVTRSATASTSSSLCVMTMIAVPPALSSRSTREQLLRLLRRQHRRRLVQDQHLGVAVQRLEDLDALLLARPRGSRRGPAAPPPGRSACATARGRAPRAAGMSIATPLRGSAARTMFSATVITGISMKCWCTMPIRASMASDGDEKLHRPAVEQDLAGVGPVQPVEAVHQRRLAGAVLAEQGVDLARRARRDRPRRWRRCPGRPW